MLWKQEATIIRSAEEKAIIEGRAKRKEKENGKSEEEEKEGDEEEKGEAPKAKTSQEAEPMI